MPFKDDSLIHLWLQGEIPVPWGLFNRDGDQAGINKGPLFTLPQNTFGWKVNEAYWEGSWNTEEHDVT